MPGAGAHCEPDHEDTHDKPDYKKPDAIAHGTLETLSATLYATYQAIAASCVAGSAGPSAPRHLVSA